VGISTCVRERERERERESNHALAVVILAVSIAVLGLCVAEASAVPTYFSGTGHYYEAVSAPSMDWTAAMNAASALTYLGHPGYLVTITSEAENNFVTDLMGAIILDGFAGGYQPVGSPEPDGGWRWVTGEVWGYTNWNYGEPNNNGNESVLQVFAANNPDFPHRWNDYPATLGASGYVVEYNPEPAPVPEPVTLASGAIGLTCVGAYLRRRTRKATRPV
jgi:hypothetical protein